MKKVLIISMIFITIICLFWTNEVYAAYTFDFNTEFNNGASLDNQRLKVLIFRENGERVVVTDSTKCTISGGKKEIRLEEDTVFNKNEKVILFFYMEYSGLATTNQRASFDRYRV